MRKKVVVISGGLGLLGKAIGLQLLNDGFKVVFLFNKILGKLFYSPNAHIYKCDITDRQQLKEVLKDIEKEVGKINIGIHCANSKINRKKISQVYLENFKEQFEVGLFGGFNFFKALSEYFKPRKKGLLIGLTTSAIESEGISGNYGGYISSKFALKGMIKEFADDLGKYGINVCAVAVGMVAGGLNFDLPPRFFDFVSELNPAGFLTEPKDVAIAVSKICKDSSNLNGKTIIVDKLT